MASALNVLCVGSRHIVQSVCLFVRLFVCLFVVCCCWLLKQLFCWLLLRTAVCLCVCLFLSLFVCLFVVVAVDAVVGGVGVGIVVDG